MIALWIYTIGVLVAYGLGLANYLMIEGKISPRWLIYGLLISLGSWVVLIWMIYLFIKGYKR